MRQKQNLFHVGFNAADEERVGNAESRHESVKGVLRRGVKSFNDTVFLL